ncbi:hypothetical protein C8Q79DRAFT_691567 [Trametes meyenii]|nr:hypothetical protein C8Q79DRAFT_691567 [Trametes meyenii]
MDGNKRKRDDDGTVVTFYTPDRTFQRVFKGQSLEETKALVRKKLGLADDTSVRFSRLHAGRNIDLEDEDDFEAFKHLARHVPSLEVSVFIGSDPPIFTQRVSGEVTANDATSKKRKGKQRLEQHTHSETGSGRSTSTVAQTSRPSISTLDTDGVPKRKRKRREHSLQFDSEVPASRPTSIPATDTSGRDELPQQDNGEASSKASKKKSRKQKSDAASGSVALDSTTSRPISPHKSLPVAVGSKRKRQVSPEMPVSSSSQVHVPRPSTVAGAPRPLSPLSPVKKKRKKEKRAPEADMSVPSEETFVAKSTKPDKETKRRSAVGESTSTTRDVVELHAGEDADTEDDATLRKHAKRVKDKKEKKGQKERKVVIEDTAQDMQEGPPLSEELSRKRRKHKKDSESADNAVILADGPSDAGKETAEMVGARKKGKKRKSRSEDSIISSNHEDELPMSGLTEQEISGPEQAVQQKQDWEGEGAEPEDNQDEWSGIVTTTAGSVAAISSGPSNMAQDASDVSRKEKRKRRKTQLADASVDLEASTSMAIAPSPYKTQADVSDLLISQVESASAKKRVRKKSIAPSSQEVSDPDALAMVQAAVQAVLARGAAASISTSSTPSTSEQALPAPELDPVLPGRKRKAGKSKLRQAWGPEDIIDAADEGRPSIPVPTISDAATAPRSSAQSVAIALPASSSKTHVPKTMNGKKNRLSSVPSCPVCDKASAHPRSECPVVQEGPQSIRKRIAQLQKVGHDHDLVEELEVLLKEAQRRRKSTGEHRGNGVLTPIQIPSFLPTTSSDSTPSPVFPLSAASFGPSTSARSAHLPRVPAGSEISEVAIESRDEGSSNESSSSDEADEDADDAEVNHTLSASVLPASGNKSGVDLSSIDLEALLRGPVKPRGSILAQIPSHSPSEDEGNSSDDEAGLGDDLDVDFEEEEKQERAFRRMSRKFEREAPSSDDEPEPEVEDVPEDPEAESEAIVPISMDVDPNSMVAKHPELEAEDKPVEQPAEDDVAVEKSNAVSVSESDGEEVVDRASPPSSPARATSPTSNSPQSESEAEAEPDRDASSADRGDDSRVERAADVDGPVPSQETPALSKEGVEARAEPGGQDEEDEDEAAEQQVVEDTVSEGGDDVENEAEDSAPKITEQEFYDADSDEDGDAEDDSREQEVATIAPVGRELSPELGDPVSQAEPVSKPEEESGSEPIVASPDLDPGTAHEDVDTNTSARASSLDLHPGDNPSDPIESLGSFADVIERRNALDDDPIEDTDSVSDPRTTDGQPHDQDQTPNADTLASLQASTPPPALVRTPGTVSRMRDRYGRLGHGPAAREKIQSLSDQLLNSYAASQPDAVADEVQDDDGAEHVTSEDHEAPEKGTVEAMADDNADATAVSSDETQVEKEEPEEPVEINTRPRRTTRITTRRTSAMPSSSLPAPPASTPTPDPVPPSTLPVAAPRRRGARLTAEEKAAREAEKLAERERKAAEKKAEREAKEAAKRAEREAKEAAKRAAKEEKEAAKRAAKEEKEKERDKVEEGPKRGRGRATRGRGTTTTKPVSTRSRAGASPEVDDAPKEERDTTVGLDDVAAATPGFSKVSWTTLPPTQPRTQSEGAEAESSMVDELQPSSPERSEPPGFDSPQPISRTTNTTEKDEADVSREVTITQERFGDQAEDEAGEGREEEGNSLPAVTPKPKGHKEPLFIPSSSQFPDTPFGLPEDGLPESTPYGTINDTALDHDIGSQDEHNNDVFASPRTRPTRYLVSQPWRRLSDMTSQSEPLRFPAPVLSSQTLFPMSQTHGPVVPIDEDDDEEESDEGPSSESDSDAGGKKSHIPQERRAGAGVQTRKKKSALLSYA